jgi:hypothetical protein
MQSAIVQTERTSNLTIWGRALTGAGGVYFKASKQFCDGCHTPGVITDQAQVAKES